MSFYVPGLCDEKHKYKPLTMEEIEKHYESAVKSDYLPSDIVCELYEHIQYIQAERGTFERACVNALNERDKYKAECDMYRDALERCKLAWDNSMDKSHGMLPEVYLTICSLLKQCKH